jgi:hypothetical protein
MATVAVPVRRPLVSKFYVVMAWVFIAVAFGGFLGTYWLQLARGTFRGGSPLLHFHGLLFTAWTLFFLSQATLVSNRKLRSHRSWGLLGISLATAMVFVAMAVAIAGTQERIAAGYGNAARAFFIVPVSAILPFGAFVAAAVANVRRPEWHKRFMLVATVSVLQAPIARFFFLAATGGGPGMRPSFAPPLPVERALSGAFVSDLLIVAAMIHDWREDGRVHPAYWWGLGIMLAVQLGRTPFAYTDAWYRTADLLLAF